MSNIDANLYGKRKNQYKRIKFFLKNTGMFSLLVLGPRGTGKKFLLRKAFSEIQDEEWKKNTVGFANTIHFVDRHALPIKEECIDRFLNKYENQTIVIDNVDQFSAQQQENLFKILSTTDGKFGINDKMNLRFVFISSVNPDVLRDEDTSTLNRNLWDRISQLVVKLPSFEDESERIHEDFKVVWEKMKFGKLGFNELSQIPKNLYIEKFLETHASRFEGGFRDLDKIAAMYFNYRIFHYSKDEKTNEETEKLIVREIENDFFGISQYTSSAYDNVKTFVIEDGIKYKDMLDKFKWELSQWSIKHYGGVGTASKALDVDSKTIRNWRRRWANR
jgi:DNA-binding NtrC family response regulator